ncbi:methionine/alanine import family NSS transporter small subunit [Actinomyces sp. zg328]|uniref:methionine/alanine import family NSS transporter small subunit n=1 Tax=Actinomyces sp. zg328 TaxID=2609287 RepID=UPI001358B5D7|nr:methionine/alanine import family NSS transporter small subunit [Actinomyces sp. zg328]
MTGAAIILMLVAIIIIWGGLAVSVTALYVRGRREEREAREKALAAAHEHLRGGQDS